MGSSGGGGQTTSTMSSHLPAWAQPYAQDLLGSYASQVFPGQNFANSLPTAQLPSNLNQQVAPFSQDQLTGFGLSDAQTGSATGLAAAGAGNLTNTLNGDYLNPATNPYLTATANEANANLVNNYQTATAPGLMAEGQVASGGGPGFASSSGLQQQQALNQYNLGQNIGNVDTNIYGGNYAQERQNQVTGLGLVGSTQSSLYAPANQLLGTGSVQQQQGQNVLNTNYQNALAQNQYPFQLLSGLGGALGQATQGQGSTFSTAPAAPGGK